MENKEEIQSLLDKMAKIQIKQKKLEDEEDDIKEQIVAMIGDRPEKGTVKLEGHTKKVTLTFRQSITYPDKEKLWELFEILDDEAETFFTPSLKEKKAQVEKLLKSDTIDPDIVEAFLQIRLVKEGSVGFKLENL